MWVLLVRRLAVAPLVFASVTCVAFVLFRYVGDPVLALTPESATSADREELRARLGLDRSALAQYGSYLARLATGDLGLSYRYRRPVTAVIAERLSASLDLTLAALVATLAFGVPLGIAAAGGRRWSGVARVVTLTIASTPTFLSGLVLVLIFAVELDLAPAFGRPEPEWPRTWPTGLVSREGLRALALPALTLGLFQGAQVARLLAAGLSDALASDVVRAARARGAPAASQLIRHACRLAVVPVIALLGVQVGSLLAFSVAVETVFQWHGLGSLFVEAARVADIPLVAGCLLGAATVFVGLGLVADLLLAASDPRVREHQRADTR